MSTLELGATGTNGSTRKRRFTPGSLVGWIAAAVLVALLILPIGAMVVRALAPDGVLDWDGVIGTFGGYGLGMAVFNTIVISLPSTVLAVAIGSSFAWVNERTDAALGAISRFLPILPILFPTFALAIGWVLMGDKRSGLLLGVLRAIVAPFGGTIESLPIGIASYPGMIFLYTVTLAPLVYVICSAAFRQLDPSLEEMSRLSGRGRLSTFATVSLPSIRPALIMSTLLSLLLGFGMYSIPAVVGPPSRITMLSMYIANLINGQYPPRLQEATVLGLALVIVVLLAWLTLRSTLTSGRYASVGGRGLRANRITMGRWKTPLRIIIAFYLLIAVIAPIVGLFIVSFQRYWTPDFERSGFAVENLLAFTAVRGGGIELLGNTVWIAMVSATIIMIVAGFVAIASVGRAPRLSATIAAAATKVPFAIPSIVIAVGVLTAFGFAPFNLAGTYWILLIAYFFSIPIASIAAEAAAQQVGSELVDAARVNGATSMGAKLRVNFPIMLSGLAGGWAITFAHVTGDLNMVPILSGASNPIAGTALIEIFAGSGTYVQAAQISLIIGLVTVVVVGIVYGLARPRYARRLRRARRRGRAVE